MRTLRTLASMGARLAIDDFGTGFSSIAYLMDLPIDTVKFDRSMINRLPNDGMAEHMQGNLFARPMNAEATRSFFKESKYSR